MRIGKIASNAKYRMDEKFQKLQFLEVNFVCFNLKNSKNSQFEKFQKIPNLESCKNCQFGKIEKFSNSFIPRDVLEDKKMYADKICSSILLKLFYQECRVDAQERGKMFNI